MFLYPDNWEREKRTTISICVTLSFFNMSVVASKSMLAPVMGDYNNNRFIFPAPNHSLAELSRSLFVRFFATVRTSLPPFKRRTHAQWPQAGTRFLSARGNLQGFLPSSSSCHWVFCFWSDFWWEIYYCLVELQIITFASSLSDPDLQYFICYLLSNRLAGGRASAGGAVCANDFKATQDQRLLKLIIIWIVFKLITIWITSLRQLFLR